MIRMLTGKVTLSTVFRALLDVLFSWEPGGNVKECKRLLESFWNHIGYDDKDYPVGFEVAAKDNWIRMSCIPKSTNAR
ncbi:hypothetical protein BJ138DRAFT_1143858 [Hygrophoropsis aurantiaca]|uniref:Uncharacterized protein n=1 Tax=Hygrophoropsis aurantiaca TaxID=72124 RepID=A0ACB8AN97_9AGAM|nr:hypothetical protein BJ138DRAFT_1143858 [Hygrophoropsis aurantiaca]